MEENLFKLYFVIAVIVAYYGHRRGLNFWLMLFPSVAFTPIVGIIIVRVFGDPNYEPKVGKYEMPSPRTLKDDLDDLRKELNEGRITDEEFEKRKLETYNKW